MNGRAGNGPGGTTCRIGVLRALALGDLLCAVPALRMLRRRHPACHVSLIATEAARPLVERLPHLVDELVPFPGFPGIPEAPFVATRCVEGLAALQARRFDLVVGLQGSGLASNAFLALLGAAEVAGFRPPGVAAPVPGRWVPHVPHGHEIHRLLAIRPALGGHGDAEDAGAVPDDDRLEFPLAAADWADLSAVEGAGDLVPGAYAVVHAGASEPGRRWPADRFAAVAAELAAGGIPVVLTGSAAEAPITAAIAAAVGGPCLDLAGRTSLGALGALVDAARLVVTNDTGVSHVAAARRTPSVVVFTGSERERWAPLDGTRHVAVGRGIAGACRHEPGSAGHRCLGDACAARPVRPATAASGPVGTAASGPAAPAAAGPAGPVATPVVLAAVRRRLAATRPQPVRA